MARKNDWSFIFEKKKLSIKVRTETENYENKSINWGVKVCRTQCIRHEILNNFQAANLYFFQSFRYNVTYEEVRDPTRQAIGVGHVKTFGPLKESNWTHINFIRTFQVTLLEGIRGRGRGRRKTSERLSDTLRLLVASRQWHSLHGGIFLENFQKGGGGVPPRLTLIKNVIFRVSFHIRF